MINLLLDSGNPLFDSNPEFMHYLFHSEESYLNYKLKVNGYISKKEIYNRLGFDLKEDEQDEVYDGINRLLIWFKPVAVNDCGLFRIVYYIGIDFLKD